MKAINNFLVVDKIKEEPKSEGGLILTELQNEDIRYLKAKVISVGAVSYTHMTLPTILLV